MGISSKFSIERTHDQNLHIRIVNFFFTTFNSYPQMKMNSQIVLFFAGVSFARAYWLEVPKEDRPEYGTNVERDNYCPRVPPVGVCDYNSCIRDNHCKDESQKCCPGNCGFLMCVNAEEVRKQGECPDLREYPIMDDYNECKTDKNCPGHLICCGTDVQQCVEPL